MTTTDRLKAAAAGALERRRAYLDKLPGLRTVSIFLEPRQHGVEVIFRMESRWVEPEEEAKSQ